MDESAPPARRGRYGALALIVGLPVLLLGIGLVIGLTRHHGKGAHDFGSTDVKACDLLPQSAVEKALGTKVQLPPHPQTARTVKQVSYLYRSATKIVKNVDVHDLDTCEYDIFPDVGGPSIVTVTVARADKAKLQSLYHDAASNQKVQGLTVVRLPNVGDNAVLANMPEVKDSGATVIAQRGDWVVSASGFTPTAALVDLTKAFVAVPRLNTPPGPPQT
jgi:hypothetical protein